jgi:hypothetical protein
MRKKYLLPLVSMILVGLGFSGCGSTTPVTAVPTGLDSVYTEAVRTVVFQLTLKAGQDAVGRLTEIAKTPILLPATPTERPPATPTPTPQPPTETPQPPTETPESTPCNWAKFVSDVTGEAGAVIQPGSRFTKTWRVQNIGSCAWTRDYSLVFFDGDPLGGPEAVPMSDTVRPGETVDLSVDLAAPKTEGVYTAFWMLRSATGDYFGVGAQANESLYMQIEVRIPTDVAFNFSYNYCSADWSTPLGPIDCPGSEADIETGFVLLYENPVLELSRNENEPGILTFPSDGKGGSISGRFPAFRVKPGDRFRTVIGCFYDSFACNVVFQLNYSLEGGSLINLETWTEVYDNHFTRVDLDLSSLAGKSVEFVLTVLNNGESLDDWAFWLFPVIVR